jgi:hypothetical protein
MVETKKYGRYHEGTYAITGYLLSIYVENKLKLRSRRRSAIVTFGRAYRMVIIQNIKKLHHRLTIVPSILRFHLEALDPGMGFRALAMP